MVTLCLIVWGNARLFSKVIALFYIPTISVWGFQFLHILISICLLLTWIFIIINFLILAILLGMK